MRLTYKLLFVQQSEVGLSRDHNEDAYGYHASNPESLMGEVPLFVVADGMGGHAAGEVASHLAVETVLREFFSPSSASSEVHQNQSDWTDQVEGRLHQAIVRANAEVYALSQREPSMQGMGTTIVATAFTGDHMIFANVGDSRGYLLRQGRLEQVTRDHSWIARAIEDGMLSLENAAEHPNRHVIYRCLGVDPTVEVELSSRNCAPNDRILLCTDGLTDVIADAEITEWLSGEDISGISAMLIDTANQRGGPDNITLTIIDVQPAEADGNHHDPPTPVRLNTVGSRSVGTGGVLAADAHKRDLADRPTKPRVRRYTRVDDVTDHVDESDRGQRKRRGWFRRLFSRD